MSLGPYLRAQRLQSGLTQADVGKAVLLPPSNITAIEKGYKGCRDADRLAAWARAVGAPVSEVFLLAARGEGLLVGRYLDKPTARALAKLY